MRPLDRLRELHLITDQHQVACSDAHRDHVRKADLASLVNKQVIERSIEFGPSEQPRSTGDEHVPVLDGLRVKRLLDPAAGAQQLVLVATFLDPAHVQARGNAEAFSLN